MSGRNGTLRTAARLALGGVLLLAGVAHLTVLRSEFSAQVPDWLPLDDDLVIAMSGIVEIALGLALIALGRQRVAVGLIVAVFFIAIFPGNIGQWLEGTDAFGLDTDARRFARLFFQPVFIAWALWSTGAWGWLADRWRQRRRAA